MERVAGSLVTVIAIIVGGGIAVCLAVIAWLAAATFESMRMKEKRQEQELTASLMQMNEKGKDTLGELVKIRADLQELKQKVEMLLASSAGAAARDDSEGQLVQPARELRQQDNV